MSAMIFYNYFQECLLNLIPNQMQPSKQES